MTGDTCPKIFIPRIPDGTGADAVYGCTCMQPAVHVCTCTQPAGHVERGEPHFCPECGAWTLESERRQA